MNPDPDLILGLFLDAFILHFVKEFTRSESWIWRHTTTTSVLVCSCCKHRLFDIEHENCVTRRIRSKRPWVLLHNYSVTVRPAVTTFVVVCIQTHNSLHLKLRLENSYIIKDGNILKHSPVCLIFVSISSSSGQSMSSGCSRHTNRHIHRDSSLFIIIICSQTWISQEWDWQRST